MECLSELFSIIYVPSAVMVEIREGRQRGYDVPNLDRYRWIQIADPQAMPSEWLSLDLGSGELAAMALALESRKSVVLLDDRLARRTAKAADLTVWGTLKVLLEAKSLGVIEQVEPLIIRLSEKGMWISEEIQERILAIAGER